MAPILLLFAAIATLGVNTLIADEFHYVDFIQLLREGGNWTSWIWAQHNEHRVVPMKLLMALLQGPSGWSQRAEMFCSAALSALVVLLLWRLYCAAGGTSSTSGLLAFAPISWLASSLTQYENQFFGMMVCHYFAALGTVAALSLLGRGGVVSTILGLLAGVMGACSIANGFLVLPAGIALLVGQRASRVRWAIWCLGGLASLVYYFHNYHVPPHTRPFHWTVGNIADAMALTLRTIGAPLAAGSVEWAATLGIALVVASVVIVVGWVRAEPLRREREALGVGFLMFGLASAVMVGVGRLAMHGDPLVSRYITYTTFAWLGTYFIVLAHARTGGDARYRIAAWSLLVPGIIAAELHGFSQARSWQRERLLDQYVLQTFDLQPDPVVARLGPAAGVKRKAAYLRAEGLSAFAEPQRIVMLMPQLNATPTGEILAGRAVEQRFACPVEDLHDVGVMILPAARPEGEAVIVTVTSGTHQLARRAVDTVNIRQWTWVQVPLVEPLRQCPGTELVVRIESASGQAGTGVSVLATEPPYYVGALSQAGAAIPDRRLGMALNAYRYGVLP